MRGLMPTDAPAPPARVRTSGTAGTRAARAHSASGARSFHCCDHVRRVARVEEVRFVCLRGDEPSPVPLKVAL